MKYKNQIERTDMLTQSWIFSRPSQAYIKIFCVSPDNKPKEPLMETWTILHKHLNQTKHVKSKGPL